MDAALRLGVGHPLHPMHARLEFQLREDAASGHAGDDFLEAACGPLAGREQLDLPALGLRIALIHAIEIAREDRGFVAARARAQFEDGAALVRCILGQQRDADLLFEFSETLLRFALLHLSQFAHLRVERGIGEHGFNARIILLRLPQGADGVDDGVEIGEFARQRDEIRTAHALAKARREFLVATQDEVEFVFWQHGGLDGSAGKRRVN